MKTLIFYIVLLLTSYNVLCMDGEIWFYIDDNIPNVSIMLKL